MENIINNNPLRRVKEKTMSLVKRIRLRIEKMDIENKELKTDLALAESAIKRAMAKVNESQALIDDLAKIIFDLKNGIPA